MSSSNRMKETRRELERQGFTATKTRGGHWRFEHPDVQGPVFAPDTPSDHRGIRESSGPRTAEDAVGPLTSSNWDRPCGRSHPHTHRG